jgi:hypothetical protein
VTIEYREERVVFLIFVYFEGFRGKSPNFFVEHKVRWVLDEYFKPKYNKFQKCEYNALLSFSFPSLISSSTRRIILRTKRRVLEKNIDNSVQSHWAELLYFDNIEKLDTKFSDKKKINKAFWINVYNLHVIGVVNKFPVESVKNWDLANIQESTS